MSLISYGRDDGKERWTCLLHEGGFMHTHSKNTQASATPACDGKYVYWVAMVKDAIWVSAVTLDGKIAWQTEAGPFVSMHGYGSSPVLWRNLVIVQGDSNGPGWLATLDKESGKVYWRVQRGSGASFATPIIAEIAGKTQLLLPGQDQVISYNPADGEKLWQCPGPATVCANTMAWSGDLVFASGGYPQRATWAIKADGSGQVVWKKNWKCYVPSMLIDGDRLIVPQDDGIVHCVEAATGKELWTKRLGGDLTASPVLADGKLYLTTEAGTTFVLRAGSTFEQLAENDNGERCYATPTICGGRIYLRTFGKLMCVGEGI
jgi:outer membrane protein assembly factor BamB